MTAIRNSYYPI
ncbi:Protein of unknown function [Escherichia coli]|nr:Protein of unknown function [Escherichia coli]CDU38748.1 Protein of unknown function [Escherichia coli]